MMKNNIADVKCGKINHAGFLINLRECIPSLNIRYEENGTFITDDYYYWIACEYIHVEDWLALIGFTGWMLGIKNADSLFSEYLEGLD